MTATTRPAPDSEARHPPHASLSPELSSQVGPAPHRIVVVGHGMVAHRFVEELDRRARPGSCEVTVLGEEPYEPYNRLLLGEVLAGRADLAGLTLPTTPRCVQVHRGLAAVALDRQARVVRDAAGGTHPYDTVVLATGADAARPPLAVDPDAGELPAGVRTLRTLDDCRGLLALRGRRRPDGSPLRVTVLGGGVLGLEAARALAGHGCAVTVVHSGDHPMDRQLDATGGAVLRRCLRDRHIRSVTRSRATGLSVDDGGHVTGLVLGTGLRLPTDVLLVTAGVRPRADLARGAGLDVARGILVGADLRTDRDRRVAAIGDCAQTPDGCPGLLAPGWEQASQLARSLAAELNGETPSALLSTPAEGPRHPETATDIVRLKAQDLDVVSFGTMPADPDPEPDDDLEPDDDTVDTERDAPRPPPPVRSDPSPDAPGSDEPADPAQGVAAGPRVLALLDPTGRRSIRIAVQDGRVVAAQLVGAGSLAADLLVAYEHGTPIPLDPARLLVAAGPGGAGGAGGLAVATTPAQIPGRATICRCNGVTKAAIVGAFESGERTLPAVAGCTRATTGCGGCTSAVEGILEWLTAADPDQTPEPEPSPTRSSSLIQTGLMRRV